MIKVRKKRGKKETGGSEKEIAICNRAKGQKGREQAEEEKEKRIESREVGTRRQVSL